MPLDIISFAFNWLQPKKWWKGIVGASGERRNVREKLEEFRKSENLNWGGIVKTETLKQI